jgi:hypothetical protein
MILAPLFGTALVVAVATGPLDDPSGARSLSTQQKNMVTQPLVRSATDCIVRAVIADPRYNVKDAAELGSEISDLIVDLMPSCIAPVRAMIDAYDLYYGEGSGQAFFMGPYLDVLPKVIVEAGQKASR